MSHDLLPALHYCGAPRGNHRLLLIPADDRLPGDLPERATWQRLLKRKAMPPAELAKTPLATDLADGSRTVLAMVDMARSRFERLTLLRKAVMSLLEEKPAGLCLVPLGIGQAALEEVVYVALVNGVPLPAQKKQVAFPLKEIVITGRRPHAESKPAGRRLADADFSEVTALARANLQARTLTQLPPNQLDPPRYRARLRDLAKQHGFAIEEYDFARLKKMGAGAFCAVAQGSDPKSGGGAAIVHLAWRPKKPVKRLALVGKGICHDTGGHNLKPAAYMANMHEDMSGSAVALSLLCAAAELKLPVAIDCWLAIARNQISSSAYVPGDIVSALDGTTIEVVHTDAEGRMVLADTLALAARGKPALIIDFATLTGSMKTALGRRYAGLFASSDELAQHAVAAGQACGERVCVFPQDADYDSGLDSKVADVKQCTLDPDPDHILAARFLGRFVGTTPWLHMDLSASRCNGGLGAVASDLTGFGVGWGIAVLQRWLDS